MRNLLSHNQSSASPSRVNQFTPGKNKIDRHDSSQLEPSSPVFGCSKNSICKQEIVAKSLQSPSLFDEDQNVISVDDRDETDSPPIKTIHNEESARKKDLVTTDVDLSICQNDSVSVLAGMSYGGGAGVTSVNSKQCKGQARIERAENRIWRKPHHLPMSKSSLLCDQYDQNKNAKGMVQKTSNLTKRVETNDHSMTAESYDPDETRDSKCLSMLVSDCGSVKKSKASVLMLKKTTEGSRRNFRGEQGNINIETITEPQFTSTQNYHGALHSGLKYTKHLHKSNLITAEEWHEHDNFDKDISDEETGGAKNEQDRASIFTVNTNINGTIDPNVHLSQYDSPEEEYHEDKSSIVSDRKQMNSSNLAMCSQSSAKVSNCSVKSVVFGGKLKKTVRDSRSKKHDIMEKGSEVEVLDHESFLNMCDGN